jgi:AraC-like DNA-binding protein
MTHRRGVPDDNARAVVRRPPDTDADAAWQATTSLSAWETLVSAAAVPLTASVLSAEGPFHARIRVQQLHQARLVRLAAAPHRLRHRPDPDRRAEPGLVGILLPRRGSVTVAQYGRAVALQPGEWGLVDTGAGFELELHDSGELLAFVCPRDLLAEPVQTIERLAATRLGAGGTVAGMVHPLLVCLDEAIDGERPTHAARLECCVVDLVATLLVEQLGGRVYGDDPKALLLSSIRRFIEARLADSALSPDEIAAAHHISTRYLQKLFSAQHTTVSGWVRQRRLEHCRDDLVDPRKAREPVSVLAARWGLLDAPHFSRLFKAEYGLSPRQYRQLHLSDRWIVGQPEPAAGGRKIVAVAGCDDVASLAVESR